MGASDASPIPLPIENGMFGGKKQLGLPLQPRDEVVRIIPTIAANRFIMNIAGSTSIGNTMVSAIGGAFAFVAMRPPLLPLA